MRFLLVLILACQAAAATYRAVVNPMDCGWDAVGSGGAIWPNGWPHAYPLAGPWSWDGDLGLWLGSPTPGNPDVLSSTGYVDVEVTCSSMGGLRRVLLPVTLRWYEVGSEIWCRVDGPLCQSIPLGMGTLDVTHSLTGSRIVVVDFRLLRGDGTTQWMSTTTWTASSGARTWTLGPLDCGGRLQIRLSVWADSVDPNAPRDLLLGEWADVAPDQVDPLHWSVNINFPPIPMSDREGFFLRDRANLQALVELGQQQLARLSELSTNQTAESLLDQRLREASLRQTNAIDLVLTNAGAGYINAVSNAVPNVFLSFMPSTPSAPPGSPMDDWLVSLWGHTIDLNPRRFYDSYVPGGWEKVNEYMYALAVLAWASWAAREAARAIDSALAAAQPVPPGGWLDFLGPFGATVRVALVAVALATLLVVQTMLFNYLLSSGPIGRLADWALPSGGPWARMWRMANDLVPVRDLVALAVSALVARLWLRGVATALIAARWFAASSRP